MNFLPPARTGRWLAWSAGYALLLWLLLILHRYMWLGEPFNLILAVRWAILAIVISVIVNGFGWLGAQLVWIFSTAGTVAGLLLMYLYTYREMSGFEDLAGFLSFGLFTAGGFALGLIAEGGRLLIHYWRTR
ncbi:hypothetical protein MKX42_27205 [Paenibacillus sp. FSL R7-0204]|uniref:hypothetical protein n=1 Tax=Paenibacillus sp. FSL R7-0204 TaxID=2921675 RepID=UPI0030F5AA42